MAAPTSGPGPLGSLLLLLLLATPTWVASISHPHAKSQENSLSSDVGRSPSQSLGGGPFSPGGTWAQRPGLAPPHSPTRYPLPDPWPAPPVVWPWRPLSICSSPQPVDSQFCRARSWVECQPPFRNGRGRSACITLAYTSAVAPSSMPTGC